MKSLFQILTVITLCFSSSAFAHTSDERYVNGMIVDLSTAPIAPWVDEKVGLLFSFLDPKNFQVIDTVTEATITVIATFRDNGKPQAVVHQSEVLPVERGTLNYTYVFTEAGTYDIHINFKTTDGQFYETGYRRQIREGGGQDQRRIFFEGALIGSGSILALFMIKKYMKQSQA